MNILHAKEAQLPVVRTLFREYQQWLGIDLCFQGFEQELADLPGRYAEPLGCVLLAQQGMKSSVVWRCDLIRGRKPS